MSATIKGGSVSLSLEPIEGALDYRVYPLPKDSDVSATSDGAVTVKNAIYRCAGARQAPAIGEGSKSSAIVRAVVADKVVGYTRSVDEATLGYVYTTPGDGRIPVYALGDPSPTGDNTCAEFRWQESRVTTFTTSDDQRAALIAKKWRDDGIAFYVPSGDSGTKPVYYKLDTSNFPSHLYYVDGPEATKRGKGEAVFNVLTDSASDTVPLMRVFYAVDCGDFHDVLVPGAARFDRASHQGDQRTMFDLHWSGITDDTTLVVEALDQGCPYPGLLAPQSRKAAKEEDVDYPAFLTLDDARAASPTGEVYINGQYDVGNKPKPIARSFIKVKPGPKPDLDWYAGFAPDDALPDWVNGSWNDPCKNPANPDCLREYRQISDFADVTFSSTTPNRFMLGRVLGELWVIYADVGADVGGKFRLTPNQKAQIADDSYLHLTMEVDSFTTARRYPQFLISDADAPIQWNMPDHNNLVIQTFPDGETANWPATLQLQVCDHRAWEVNDQCPSTDFYRNLNSQGDITSLNPIPELGEHTGVDRSTSFDVYVSSKRAYTFMDGQPWGCVDLPKSGVPQKGPVTVAFGDVLYHSGVDPVFSYHAQHLQVETRRHYNNLGFKSGVEAPAWDENIHPCYGPNSITGGETD